MKPEYSQQANSRTTSSNKTIGPDRDQVLDYSMNLPDSKPDSEQNSEIGQARFIGVNPVLPVKNIIEAARFYEEVLGFSVDVIWEDPAYACVSRGSVVIEFGEARENHVGSSVCYIRLENVDVFYEALQNHNPYHYDIEYVGDFADRHYGSRDFRIRDNNGNLLIFGSPLVDQEEIILASNVA